MNRKRGSVRLGIVVGLIWLMALASFGISWVPVAGEKGLAVIEVKPQNQNGVNENIRVSEISRGDSAQSIPEGVLAGRYVILKGDYVPENAGTPQPDVRIFRMLPMKTDIDQPFRARGLSVEAFLPYNAVLVRGSPDALAKASHMKEVDWSSPYFPVYKFTFPISKFPGERGFDLQLYRASDPKDVEFLSGAVGARVLSVSDNRPMADPVVAVRTTYDGIMAFAESPHVKQIWIHTDVALNDAIPQSYWSEGRGGILPLNDRAGEVIKTHDVWYAAYNGYH
jgi:hypothetical protein